MVYVGHMTNRRPRPDREFSPWGGLLLAVMVSLIIWIVIFRWVF